MVERSQRRSTLGTNRFSVISLTSQPATIIAILLIKFQIHPRNLYERRETFIARMVIFHGRFLRSPYSHKWRTTLIYRTLSNWLDRYIDTNSHVSLQ